MDPPQGLSKFGDDEGSRSRGSPAIIKAGIAWWDQLHYGTIDSASSPMEQQAVRGGSPVPQIARVRLKSSLKPPSDPNELYSNQLERFLSLLVQADSRLVGSNMGHRIQLVDCRISVEGQEVDVLTETVCKRLTAILRQSDPWEDTVQSLEAFVEEKGRLPIRRVRDERHLTYWLNTQCAQLRAGLLFQHRWQRLINSSSPLIRQRVQGWLLHDQDGKFRGKCLELKAYLETHGKLPHFTRKAPRTLQRNCLALWLSSLRDRGGWTKPDRRAMLESLHPLVAQLVARWETYASEARSLGGGKRTPSPR